MGINLAVEASCSAWHTLNLRVYFEDTDAQGVVYFANYLRFMERGRTEWLRAQGVEQEPLMREANLCFSLIDTDVQFLRPARFDDQLAVRTGLESARGARVIFQQLIYRDTQEGELLCKARCSAACVAADTFKPRRLPLDLFNSLAAEA